MAVAGLMVHPWLRAAEPADMIAFKNGDKVAFLGDSITQAGADKPTGYVKLLQAALNNEGIGIEVIRAGLSGNKSNQMLERLQKDVLDKKPDWMTLSCGVNDVWHGPNGVSLHQYRTNITLIVDQAQQAGIRVIILTSTMISEDPAGPHNITLAGYNDFLREVATEKGCLLADLNADMQVLVKAHRAVLGTQPYYDLVTSDGVHMNVAGDSMMAVGILRALGMPEDRIQAAIQSWARMPAKLEQRFPVSYADALYVETLPRNERNALMGELYHRSSPLVDQVLGEKVGLKPPALLEGVTGSPEILGPAYGGYLYRLPDFQKGARILFQGDSITDMGRSRDPNTTDKNHIHGHSFVFVIAGQLGLEMPDRRLEFINRGLSGNTVADLKTRWQVDAIEAKPDVLSVLIGVNNVLLNKDLATFEADYRHILDASRKANPELKLVLLDPFALEAGSFAVNEGRWTGMREGIDNLLPVVARLAVEYDAVHIKTQEILDAASEHTSPDYWLWDGVHPTAQGHELIARHWLKEVSARWPCGLTNRTP
jgi:lysophospholipase L1-like esterase